MGEFVVGIDQGGTNIRTGLISDAGELLAVKEKRLPSERKPETGVQFAIEVVKELLHDNGSPAICAIGAGVTGPVDPAKGTVISPHTDPPWQFTPYSEPIRQAFGVPVVLENDADAAALGEYWMGAGKGISRLYVVTVGTGIGTSFIENGKIFRGKDGLHPEGGHIIIDASSDTHCYCEMRGCWEALASGDGFTVQCRTRYLQDEDWRKRLPLEKVEDLSAAKVIEAGQNGDPAALELIAKQGEYLGVGLLNIISCFIPEKVIMTGGLLKHFDLFEPYIRNVLARHQVLVPASEVLVEKDSLDYLSGVYGAAFAALTAVQPVN